MFNFWFIAVPSFAIIAMFAGYKMVGQTKRYNTMVINRSTKSEMPLAFFLSLIATAMIARESWRGMLDGIDATISSDDPTGVWALIMLGIVLVGACMLLTVVYCQIMQVAATRKVGRYIKYCDRNGVKYVVR